MYWSIGFPILCLSSNDYIVLCEKNSSGDPMKDQICLWSQSRYYRTPVGCTPPPFATLQILGDTVFLCSSIFVGILFYCIWGWSSSSVYYCIKRLSSYDCLLSQLVTTVCDWVWISWWHFTDGLCLFSHKPPPQSPADVEIIPRKCYSPWQCERWGGVTDWGTIVPF